MLVLSVVAAVWPERVQRVALRYAARSSSPGVLTQLVENDGYVGVCRVIGCVFIFMACFGLLGLALM